MTSALDIYASNFGHSHEQAVEAVYQAGLADGLATASKAFLDAIPEPVPAPAPAIESAPAPTPLPPIEGTPT